MDFDSFESRKRLELEAMFESRLQRDFFSFWIFLIINLLLLLEVALSRAWKQLRYFRIDCLPRKDILKTCMWSWAALPKPHSLLSLQHWDLTLEHPWRTPWDQCADSLASCRPVWDSLPTRQTLVLTDIFSGFSSAHPSLLPVCSLFFSYHEMLFPKAPSFVLSLLCTFILFLHGLLLVLWALHRGLRGVKSLNLHRRLQDYFLTTFRIFAQLLHRSCTWLVPQRTYRFQPVSPSPLLFLNASLHLMILLFNQASKPEL